MQQSLQLSPGGINLEQEQSFGSGVQLPGDGGDTGSTQVGRDPKAQIKNLEDELAQKTKELEELQKKVDTELQVKTGRD